MSIPERITIRRAQPDDIEAIVKLNHALFQEDAGQRDPTMNLNWALEEGQVYFSGFLKREKSIILLAEDDENTAVGYLAGQVQHHYRIRPIHLTELESMYVIEAYRNLGVGTALADKFRTWSLEQGAERIAVTAYAANTKALAFYQRLGFIPRNITLEMALLVDHG